jgi:hypothetical protein
VLCIEPLTKADQGRKPDVLYPSAISGPALRNTMTNRPIGVLENASEARSSATDEDGVSEVSANRGSVLTKRASARNLSEEADISDFEILSVLGLTQNVYLPPYCRRATFLRHSLGVGLLSQTWLAAAVARETLRLSAELHRWLTAAVAFPAVWLPAPCLPFPRNWRGKRQTRRRSSV